MLTLIYGVCVCDQNNQVERAPVTPKMRQGVVEELKEAFFSGINVVM